MFPVSWISPGGRHRVACQLAFRLVTVALFSLHLLAHPVSGKNDLKSTLQNRPNVLLIMADDLGFSDLGCYGSEIKTPHLDRLARNGTRFTQFYNTARCWPTRATLLTGYYPQQVRRDQLPGIKRGNRPAWAPLLPRRLKKVGYRSYHSGKWHLDGMPVQNGFDSSYLLKDQGRFFYPKVHWKDDRKLPPVATSEQPFGDGYYGTTAIADHAIECLEDHRQNHSDQPFFHYVAFTAPHFPLHALPQDIQKYDRTYEVGWDRIRTERWERIRQLDLIKGRLSGIEYDLGPPYPFPEALKKLGPGEINRPLPWSQLTGHQKTFQAKKMAIHAAMVDRMDQEIGRLLGQLEKMQALDNTLIMFLSDNGASAEIMVRNDGHNPEAPAGSGPSYLCLGPGWSTVANTPFRRHKTWVHEGGIRTPLILHWPGQKKSEPPARFCRLPGHVIDIVPTILKVTGGQLRPFAQGPALPGKSLLPLLADVPPDSSRTLWWSHEGNRAIRSGNEKLVAARGEPWSLYQLQSDPTEQNDLAGQNAQRVRQLAAEWQSMENTFLEQLRKAPGKTGPSER